MFYFLLRRKEHAREYAKEYGDERELCANANSVQNLMCNMKISLEQALNALGIQGENRNKIREKLNS